MSVSRVTFPAVGAGFMTLVLLAFMAHLVSKQELDLDESKRITIDIWRIPQPLEQPRPKERLTRPPEAEAAPPLPKVNPATINIGGEAGSYTLPPPAGTPGSIEKMSGAGLMPLVKISPEYPARAATAGIEGYVIVEYTVTRLGLVTDPKVIESSPKGYFERAALRAIKGFRYNPHQVDGVPTDIHGVRQQFTFELEKGQG